MAEVASTQPHLKAPPPRPHVLVKHVGQLHITVQVDGGKSNSPPETRPEFEVPTCVPELPGSEWTDWYRAQIRC